ncbi:MAG: diacylglycerol kinase [Pseudomonadota bacterium]|nr:diacylglycerol kinase [Pseudomonadota bacterium]
MKSPHTGIKRIIKAFTYSYDGLTASFQSEAAFRQDILFCLIMGLLLFFLPVHGLETVLMLFSLLFILFAELVNTALETIVDRVGADYHILSKKAKDIGSLLVLMAFIQWAMIWGWILIPKFLL